MSLTLPQPVADYFASDKGDSEALTQCFTTDAVVKDEGHSYAGRASIRQWKVAASTQYEYTCEPFHVESSDGMTVVTCHLVGNFPGSPVDLRFFFRLERGKVSFLEIIP